MTKNDFYVNIKLILEQAKRAGWHWMEIQDETECAVLQFLDESFGD